MRKENAMKNQSIKNQTDCFPLSSLKIGKSAFVNKIRAESAMHKRLQDLGLTKGTKVTCILVAPSGDPKGYLVRGTIIGLRDIDANNIFMYNI